MKYTIRKTFTKRFLIYALITILVMSAYQPVSVSYGVEDVNFTVTPTYINSDLLPTVVTVTADKSAFTVGSVYPTLIDASDNSQSLSIVSSSATELKFTVPAGVSDGTYKIRISDPEGDQGTTTKYYEAKTDYSIGASSVTTTTPFDSFPKGYDEQQSVTVTGSHTSFSQGQTTVELLQNGSVIDSASITSVSSSGTGQSLVFAVSTGLTSGTYDVRFTTGDDVDTVSGGLLVRGTPAVVLDETSFTEGYSQTNVEVTGTNTGFDSNTQVQILDSNGDPTGKAGTTNVIDSDTLNFNVLTGLSAGDYTVNVTTGVEEASASLTVLSPSAELRKQSDNTALSSIGHYFGDQNLKFIGTNTNFDSNTSLAVFKGETQISGAISGTPSVNSSTEILFTLSEWTSSVGTGDLTVIATTGDETASATLSVVEPSISLSYNSDAVEDSVIAGGYKEFTIDVDGTDAFFESDTTVSVESSSTEYVKASSEVFTDAENLRFTLETGLSEGTHTVTIDLDGDGSGTNTYTTSIEVGPSASILSVSPSNILRTKSSAKTYTIYGQNTHFEAGTPSIDIGGTTSEDISNINVIDATTLTFDLIPSTVDVNGSLDLDVTVNSSVISETASLTGAFTASNQGIEATPETYYTLEKGNATITISAEGFTYNSSESNISASVGGSSVSVSRNSDTEITVTLPSGVSSGSQEVLVDNNGTQYTTAVSVVKSQQTSNTPAYKVYGYATNSDGNIVVQGNSTLDFDATYEPVIVASRNGTDYSVSFTSIDESANTLTMTLPDGLSAGYYDISLTWSSGPYAGNSLTLSNYQIKNEIDAIDIYYSGAIASNRTVYLNGSGTVTFTAIANIVNGSASTNKTSEATWTSSDTSVATISGGVATVTGRGTTNLTVAYDDDTDTITLYVKGPDSIAISGSDANIRIGESVTLAAEGTYGDSSTETLTAKATWSASNTNVSVSNNVVTGQESGQSVVSATYGGTSGTFDFTVSSIDFTPSTIRSLELGNKTVTIDGIETGTTIDSLTVGGQSVTPTDTGTAITFVPPSGLSAGSQSVVVTTGSKTHTASLTVVSSSMVLSTQLLEEGYEAFTMTATLKNTQVSTGQKPTVTFDGDTIAASSVSVDESADTVSFPIEAGKTSGDYDVTLTWTAGDYSGNSLTQPLSVAGEIDYTLSGASSVSIGSSTQLTLVANVDGTDQDVTSGVEWSSSNTDIATVSSTGSVTGISAGSATITATFQGESYTKIIIVPSNDTGGGTGGDDDDDSGSGGGGGSSPSGDSTSSGSTSQPQDVFDLDTTRGVTKQILQDVDKLTPQEAMRDVGSIAASAKNSLSSMDASLDEAKEIADAFYEINVKVLNKSDVTAIESNSIASNMALVIGAYVSRDDVSPSEALVWADKVIKQVGSETMIKTGQTSKLATQVASDVIDNVVVKLLKKNVNADTATAVFETFVKDVAQKAIRLDTAGADRARLVSRMIQTTEDVVEIAGRVEESAFAQSTVGAETTLSVDQNTLMLAAGNAIQKTEDLRLLVALNTAVDLQDRIKPRLGLNLPDVEGNVKLNLNANVVRSVKDTGAEIKVRAKGAEFVFASETLEELQDKGINLQVGRVGKLEQTLYLKDMALSLRSNIAQVDNTKQIELDGYSELINKPSLSLNFDENVIFVPEYVNVFVYDEDSAQWEFVKSQVDQARGKVSFKPPHFSVYSVVEYSRSFDDVKSHWSRDFVEAMASRGLTSGVSETMFGPDYSITRAQFATLLANALGLEGQPASAFNDVPQDTWYYRPVNLAYEAGLVSGMGDGMFNPNANITREQMAVMIAKAYKIMLGSDMIGLESTITDMNSVSPWAKDAVKAVDYHGVVSGFEDGSFKPNDNATRAHGIVMLKKLLDLK
ncbi:S-layer homology domain-containing protein [Fusibacter sp. JL216-2]|uniref:S-layer homology domain-containing protein n=1 Tax=Fusibacter sp. JL216-2 TaxID=3071453 RepID=UPI003D33C611